MITRKQWNKFILVLFVLQENQYNITKELLTIKVDFNTKKLYQTDDKNSVKITYRYPKAIQQNYIDIKLEDMYSKIYIDGMPLPKLLKFNRIMRFLVD